jgi:SAM-dependent methyltransferase
MFEHYGTAEERYVELSEIYESLFPFDDDAQATVKFLEGLAPRGRMLELGIGTGRIALPLAERGCEITGVDTSADMVKILRSKDPQGSVNLVFGNMADPQVDGGFDVVYSVYNTIFALLSQEQQLQSVVSASRALIPGGKLVIEAMIPKFPVARDPLAAMGDYNDDLRTLTFKVTRHDHLRQIVEHRHVYLAKDGVKVLPSVHRYVHIAELDLMAALAGMTLDGRYSDWKGAELSANSTRHISVYRKTGSLTD